MHIDGCTDYFTGRSVDNSIPTTGARVCSAKFMGSQRLLDAFSTLQAELIALLLTLEHFLNHGNGAVVIHTIVACLGIHKVQKCLVSLNWILSHIGIPGNELADRLAIKSPRTDTIATNVQTSLS